jgi:hypothetical protein
MARYYKQAFHNIPRLAKYDVVVWLDATVEILSPYTAAIMLETLASGSHIASWAHMARSSLDDEVRWRLSPHAPPPSRWPPCPSMRPFHASVLNR